MSGNKAAMPLSNVPLVNKNDQITIAWQRFLLALLDAGGSVNVVLNGKTISGAALDFGSGFFGAVSGQSVSLSSGISIIENDDTIVGVSTVTLKGNFNANGSGSSATITVPPGAVQVGAYGVIVNEAAEILNFTGNVRVNSVGDEVYISIGAPLIENQGTSIGSATTFNAGALLQNSIAGNVVTTSFAGIPAQHGTTSLGAFIDLEIGSGLNGSIGTAGNTLTLSASLSGSALDITNGTISANDVATIVTGPNLPMTISSGVALSVVQKSINSTLASPPTPGNTVVIILDVLGTGKSAPGAIANFSQLATEYNGYTGGAVYSQVYETGNNYANTVSETSNYVCYEFENLTGIDGYAQPGTVSGSTETISVTPRTGYNFIYAIFTGNVGQVVSSTIPAGMTQDFVNSGGNCDWGGYIAGQSGNAAVGFTGTLNDGVITCFVAQGNTAGAQVVDLDARISAVLNNGSTLSAGEITSSIGDISLSGTGTILNLSQGPIILSNQTVHNDIIPVGKNGLLLGVPTIAAGCTLTIGSGSTLFIGS